MGVGGLGGGAYTSDYGNLRHLIIKQIMWCLIFTVFFVLESANNQKLMLEYEKFQELQAKSQKMQEDYERQLQEMEENRERALEELTEYYETRLQEMTSKLEQVRTVYVHVYT